MNVKRRLLSVLLGLLVTLVLGSNSTYAASKSMYVTSSFQDLNPDKVNKVTLFNIPNKNAQYTIWLPGLYVESKEKITSSNPGVVTCKKTAWRSEYAIIHGKKDWKSYYICSVYPRGEEYI